ITVWVIRVEDDVLRFQHVDGVAQVTLVGVTRDEALLAEDLTRLALWPVTFDEASLPADRVVVHLAEPGRHPGGVRLVEGDAQLAETVQHTPEDHAGHGQLPDRKSTRLNSSH